MKKRWKKLYETQETIICCLSGLPITCRQDFSREHFVPKSRTTPEFSGDSYNIRPAIKIINNIKGDLLPCEWVLLRKERLLYALLHYNLTKHNKSIIIKTLDRFATEKELLNPCQYCILSNAKEQCDVARNMAGYRIPQLSSFKSR